MKHAQHSLLSIYRSAAPQTRWEAHDVLPYWMAAVGREVSNRTHPTWLAKGRLTVEVDGQEWRHQLFTLTGTILARLNQLLGESLVNSIDFRLAKPPRRPPGRAEAAAVRAEATDEASGIADPQLRRLYRASMRRSR